MLMYTASLSYSRPPTSDMGAYSSFCFSSSFLCFFSVLGSGQGSDSRGLHSSTFRLNVSTFCGIGGVFRGCLGSV